MEAELEGIPQEWIEAIKAQFDTLHVMPYILIGSPARRTCEFLEDFPKKES